MRTSSLAIAVTFGVLMATSSTMGFDGTHAPNTPLSPTEAFRDGTQALRVGQTAKAVTSLQYAADNGHALAQWKLGRMYAEGDGVPRDDFRAFKYFQQVVADHGEDNPDQPQARFVANAYVELGQYYRDGIPNSPVKADPAHARDMFAYAASYFGDPDAQYNLGGLYLSGTGARRDTRQAVRWFVLAANKGHYESQAVLGRILFKGEDMPRQRALGLMWLTLASDGCAGQVQWIADARKAAFEQATEDEREMALMMIKRRLNEGREW